MTNKLLIALTSLSALFVPLLSLLYKGSTWQLTTEVAESATAFLVLTSATAFLYLYNKKASHDAIQHQGVKVGLLLGFIWTIEISVNNIIQPGLPLRDVLDDLFWAIIACCILALSVVTTYRAKKVTEGTKVGFWTGTASGSVACLTALSFIILGMPLLLADPLNIAEWTRERGTTSNLHMSEYLAYQTVTGAILHFVVLGTIMGVLLGIIGSLLAKLGVQIAKSSALH